MRLWTFQFPNVLRILRRDGAYRPRWSQVQWVGEAWVLAYHWMVDEMIERRLLRHRIAPIWAWYRAPDDMPPGQSSADSLFGPIDREVVRLELNVPEQFVLISDYGAWDDVTSLAFDSLKARQKLIVPESIRAKVFATNDLPKRSDLEYVELQACLPELRWRHVVGIRRFGIPDYDTMQSDSYNPCAFD